MGIVKLDPPSMARVLTACLSTVPSSINRRNFVVVPQEVASKYKSRCGRSAAERVPRRQILKSMTPSVVLLIAVFAFILGFIVALSVFVGRPTPSRSPTPPVTSSNSPEVKSSACHVVGNKTACFRFASKLTRSRCSAVGGVIVDVNINSSSPSKSSSSLSSASSSTSPTICYHNVCMDYVVDNRFCFLNRSNPLSNMQLFKPQMAEAGVRGSNDSHFSTGVQGTFHPHFFMHKSSFAVRCSVRCILTFNIATRIRCCCATINMVNKDLQSLGSWGFDRDIDPDWGRGSCRLQIVSVLREHCSALYGGDSQPEREAGANISEKRSGAEGSRGQKGRSSRAEGPRAGVKVFKEGAVIPLPAP